MSIADTRESIDAGVYRTILHRMPAGFAIFEVVRAEDGKAEDLTLADANAEFAEIIKKDLSDIGGKPITKILPGIFTWEFDWIKALAAVAQEGRGETIVEYAEGSVRKWLAVQAAPAGPGLVSVLVTDVTEEKRMQSALSLERNNLSY